MADRAAAPMFGGAHTAEPDTRREYLHLTGLPANARELAPARAALSEFVRRIGLPDTTGQDVLLATYEAMANAVEHAYPGGFGGTFDVCAVFDADSGALSVTVDDFGQWNHMGPDPASRRGRGLSLMRACSDRADVTHDEHGTHVQLQWSRP